MIQSLSRACWARVLQCAAAIHLLTQTDTSLQVYHYNLDTGTYHNPLQLRYSYHVKQRQSLDLEAMQAAADMLVGTHDFTQLSNDSPERLRRNPIKTLHRFDVVQVAPNHVRLEVS